MKFVRPHRRTVLAVAVISAIGGPALAAAPAVTVADAWCRAAPKGALAGGCYLTLTARTSGRLVAVETAAADRAEIHTMDMTGGIMRMRQLRDGIALPADQAVALKPGGLHLMIIGPKQQLTAGGAIPLTLRFQAAPPLSLKAPVRAAALR